MHTINRPGDARRMKRSRKAEPKWFAGYMHDFTGPQGSILSVCCEGPECEVCMMDPEAKERADAFRRGLRSPAASHIIADERGPA
jgi:hypothetical protein